LAQNSTPPAGGAKRLDKVDDGGAVFMTSSSEQVGESEIRWVELDAVPEMGVERGFVNKLFNEDKVGIEEEEVVRGFGGGSAKRSVNPDDWVVFVLTFAGKACKFCVTVVAASVWAFLLEVACRDVVEDEILGTKRLAKPKEDGDELDAGAVFKSRGARGGPPNNDCSDGGAETGRAACCCDWFNGSGARVDEE